jgi:hypothetical protein
MLTVSGVSAIYLTKIEQLTDNKAGVGGGKIPAKGR